MALSLQYVIFNILKVNVDEKSLENGANLELAQMNTVMAP